MKLSISRHLIHAAAVLSSLAVCSAVFGCDSENAFEVLEPPNQKGKGEAALARGDHSAAISSLESALRDNPNDIEIRKMLANAYMAKSGVNTIEILQKISGDQDKTDWGSLIAAMPDGSSANQAGLTRAVALLEAIPPESRTDDERYQLAMAQTSLAVVTAKKYGANEQGQVPPEQVGQISDEDASIIVDQLSGAADNLGGLTQGGADTASTKIDAVVTQIGAAEGEDQGAKVRSFLSRDRP
jgi:tetratricopeptide (TPR) repeat protein